MQWNVSNLDEFNTAACELFAILQDRYIDHDYACVVGLSGDLGAGKTTATQTFGRILGVQETIQSPTFVIRKSYDTNHPIFKKLIHIDAYRLDDKDNLSVLRFDEDFKNPNTLVIIEWPEMIPDILPNNIITVIINHMGNGRDICIT